MPDWIAIDWGTTNLRVWAMSDAGEVQHEASSDQGMLNVPSGGFEEKLLDLIDAWLSPEKPTLALAAGMVGARQGWAEAPYAELPCSGLDVGAMIRVPVSDPRLDMRILPGLCQRDPADVMRGEETQICGFLSEHPDFEGMICLPGTHSKWVEVRDGQVTRFHTALTGELFALLSEQSVLKHSMSDGWDDAAFLDGVRGGMRAPEALIANLFAIRAASLLQDVAPGAGKARLSGMLISAELAAATPEIGQVALIGSGKMTDLYSQALIAHGIRPIPFDAGRATQTGLTSAYRAITGA